MNIRKILVPTDFSACADKALALGIKLTQEGGRELFICHINPVPAGGDAMFFINAEVLDGIEKETENAFQKLIARFPELKKIRHEFVQKTGLSINKVREVVKEEEVDLIIMGTKGRDRSIEAYFGSNTSDIMKRSKIPVLVVPENSEFKSIRSIAFATDFEESNQADSIGTLTELAMILESEIHIIHVVKNKKLPKVSIDSNQTEEWAKEMKGVEHHYHFVSDDSVEQGIIRYAYENEIQLLAVLSKSYNLLDRLFHKSLSKRLVYHSKLPLLVLK